MGELMNILEHKGKVLHQIGPDATVLEAVQVMCMAKCGALFVATGGAPVGIFSERDLMTRVVLQRREPGETTVGAVMTKDVMCVDFSAEPSEALAIMTRHRVRHLPVVEGRKVIGMLSIGDVVNWLLENRESEVRSLREYVSGGFESYTVTHDAPVEERPRRSG